MMKDGILSPKTENKARVPALTAALQLSTGSSSQCSEERGNESHTFTKENLKLFQFAEDMMVF